MTDIDTFRQMLAATLRSAAERRRRSFAYQQPSGQDLKAVDLLERLAADAPHLDPGVYRTCGSVLIEEPLARRFGQQRDALLAEIGIMVCPSSATALVVWLHGQVIDDAMPVGRGGAASRHVGARPAAASGAQISISVPISTTCEVGTSK